MCIKIDIDKLQHSNPQMTELVVRIVNCHGEFWKLMFGMIMIGKKNKAGYTVRILINVRWNKIN